tara:strand:- start:1706 stop:1873 length:168 start_codon:yes stop_codon:yes gene_type:complete
MYLLTLAKVAAGFIEVILKETCIPDDANCCANALVPIKVKDNKNNLKIFIFPPFI